MKKVAISVHATDDFSLELIKGLKEFDYIHVDIMDGKFVDTQSNNLNVLKLLQEKHDIPIITHLMVVNPLEYFPKISDYCDIIIFHYESGGNREKLINNIKSFSKKVGIAINPDTKLETILPFLNKIDLVLIMSVYPGKSGQEFIWEVLDKLNLLIGYRHQNKLEFQIDIDGGINTENCKFIHADILTSASSILKSQDPNSVIKSLKYSDEK